MHTGIPSCQTDIDIAYRHIWTIVDERATVLWYPICLNCVVWFTTSQWLQPDTRAFCELEEIPSPMLLLMDVDGRSVARRPVGWWEFCFNHPVVRCQILTYAVCCSPSLPYCSHIPPLPVLCIGMRPVRQRWWAWDWQPVLFSVRVDRISIWIFCFNQHILISIC